MGFRDVAFLLSRANFLTTFLTNCGRGDDLRTTTCFRTVVGCKQGHAPCEILLFHQSLFLCQLNFMEITRLLQNGGDIWSPSLLGILLDLK